MLRLVKDGPEIPLEVLANNFRNQVEQTGRVPTEPLHVKPCWPIEAVAMHLTTGDIRESRAGEQH